ncbi:MAG TPA: 4Fe-4S dicluster domain-containing protein, partial [Candidatus Melainabacteria bacterium]|nr:4Fe-4S dicluster domain-containing protein [Candidatus Melainabacteria bacterium]
IDHDKCIQCDLCYIACNDAAHQCIDLKEMKLVEGANGSGSNGGQPERRWPVVREEDCVGCALCSSVCPVDDCITMVEVDSERPHVTWNELTTKRPEVLEWDKMEEYRKEANIHIH